MDDLYIFHHIPKCGGTTLSRIIDKTYNPSNLYAVNSSKPDFEASFQTLKQMDAESIKQLRMVRGHATYGLDKILKRPCKYITLLRDPGRRFVSAYFHAISEPGSQLGDRLRNSGATLKQLAEADDEELGRDYFVRHFAGVPEAADATDGTAYLELAKNNLSRDFLVVGITERMDESVLLLSQLLGWKTQRYRSHNISRQYSIDNVDPEIMRIFRERNPNDVKLYKFALSRFDKQTRDIPFFGDNLDNFRMRNRVYNLWRDRIDYLKRPLRPVQRLLSVFC